MQEPYRTSGYWNKRVRLAGDDRKNMIFVDPRFDRYEGRTREMLELWKNFRVLDVACGYGRFADIFSDYHGVDFSEEMLKIARREHPDKQFDLFDIHEFSPKGKYDVIFEVNSLHSLGMSPDEFNDKFRPHARKMVACLEADKFTIFEIYG